MALNYGIDVSGEGVTGRMFDNVLVIDDDPIFCEILQSYFVQSGVPHVSVASNGLDAMGIVEQQLDQLELIVMDLHMPKFDGIQMLGKLREMSFSGQIVIVSGQAVIMKAAASLGRHYELNILDTVAKPLGKSHMDRWLGIEGDVPSITDHAQGDVGLAQ